jgi:hypothetical protein
MFRLLCVLLPLTSPVSVEAQTIQLTPFVAYRAGGEFAGCSVNDDVSYGGTAAVDLTRGAGAGAGAGADVGIEFLYSHQASEVTTDRPSAAQRGDMKVDQWGLLGRRVVLRGESRARPYGEAGIGLTHHLCYLAFVNTGSNGFYCGVGAAGGCTVGFTGSLFFQADLTAGITVMLGRTHQGGEPY